MVQEGNTWRQFDLDMKSEMIPDADFLKIVIVIPTLNEEQGIGLVLDGIFEVFDGKNYSVVVVDGNSTDRTTKIALEKGAVVINQRGIGYGDALLSGFVYARDELKSSLIAMMDADATYDPNDIPVLMELIMTGDADLVIGNRFLGMEEGSMTSVNHIGNRILSLICRVFLKLKVCDTQCGLRVFSADLVDRLDLTKEGMPFATEMLVEAKFAGARIVEAPVSYRPRKGTAKLVPWKDGLMIFGTIIRLMRDTQPLLFFGGLGLLFGLLGFISGMSVTLEWLKTGSVGRVPTVALSVLLLVGCMQLLTLGLVADMIKGLRKKNSWYRKNHK